MRLRGGTPSFQQLRKELTVSATSPDNMVKSHLVAGEKLTIAFRPGAYRRYTEVALADQLASLGRLTWVGYRRGYLEALSISRGEPAVTSTRPHWDARYRRYHEAIAASVACGESASRAVRAKSKGMASWKVRIEPGTLAAMPEESFVAEALSAFQRLQADSKRKITLLKDAHFGLNIPDAIRSAMNLPKRPPAP